MSTTHHSSFDNSSAIVRDSDIAIIGMACRFPGAENPQQFWQNLRDGVESITFFSDDELEEQDLTLRRDPNYVKAGAILSDIAGFDADFFGYSPSEAALLDPQQRLLLECAWEALERAGYAPDAYPGRVAVYAGSSMSNYFLNQVHAGEPFTEASLRQFQANLANDRNFLPTRISYKLNLTGPSVNIQTACSTGLVVVHQACQSLLLGECDLALAGSVALRVPQKSGYLYEEGMIRSPDGHCRAFDAAAEGTLFGSGAGMVLLKRAHEALAAGDPILALIKGSAINNDGAGKVSFTAPSIAAQAAVIVDALLVAEIVPTTISYIEAHGTGTRLGDPVEILALTQAFERLRSQDILPNQFCAIGSVKSNIGHLDEAAGMAGLIKTVLALQHKQLPPSLHFKQPNPQIDFENSPFYVKTELSKWETNGTARRAGVSSFGMGGTNCHLVLEEAPPSNKVRQGTANAPSWHILTLSARNKQALRELAGRYDAFFEQQPMVNLADVCYTANTGRKHFPVRGALVAASVLELREQLQAFAQSAIVPRAREAGTNKIAFLFTGQGSQYVNMGRELYETKLTFRHTLNRCDEILRPLLGKSILSVLYPDNSIGQDTQFGDVPDLTLINETIYTQPALFALEYALAQLWRSWGIEPDVLMGHSVGEIVAACVAGVFSLEDGLNLVAARGRLMQALPRPPQNWGGPRGGGVMVSVMSNETRVRKAMAPYPQGADVSIAAVNGPESVVISGKEELVQLVVAQLAAEAALPSEGVKSRQLSVSHAFHSPLMEPMLAEFRQIASRISYSAPQIALVSNVTGQLITNEVTNPDYWVRHVRQTVRFADGCATLHEQGVRIMVEIGPKPILLGMAKQALHKISGPEHDSTLVMLPSLRQNLHDQQQILQSLGHLYTYGYDVNWARFEQYAGGRKVALPTYPFQRQRYWIDAPKQKPSKRWVRPLIEKVFKSPLIKETIFESEFSVEALPFLNEHLVYGEVVSPAACQFALICNGAELLYHSAEFQLVDVVLPQALILPAGQTRLIQCVLTPLEGDKTGENFDFKLISVADRETVDEPYTHLSGQLIRQAYVSPQPIVLDEVRTRCTQQLDRNTLYARTEQQNIMKGPSFQWFSDVWRSKNEVLGQFRLPQILDPITEHVIHPGLLDACIELAIVTQKTDESHETWLPFSCQSLQIFQVVGGTEWWCHVQEVGPQQWDIRLVDTAGQTILYLRGLKARRSHAAQLVGLEPFFPSGTQDQGMPWRDWLYEIEWLPQPHFGLTPTYLPELRGLVQSLTQDLHLSEADMGQFINHERNLERFSIGYIQKALTTLGLQSVRGHRWLTDELMQELQIVPHYYALLNRLLHILAKAGCLLQEDNAWILLNEPDLSLYPVINHATQDLSRGTRNPAMKLLQRCGEGLAEVLQGRQDPLELLFPDGDSSTVTQFYQEAPAAQIMNRLMQEAVKLAIADLPKTQGIRVLEIGAGTGSTTEFILSHLPPKQTIYTFTDIGQGFLQQAQEKLADFPFVHYQRLDIEQDPMAQGFSPQQYDLVIAANVLHATQELTQTLQHIRQLLKPGGLLFLMEDTMPRAWIDLTFGLTKGWWRFSDHELRPNHPLLSTPQWQELLDTCGFDMIDALPDSSSEAAPLGEAVILARSNPSEEQREWQAPHSVPAGLVLLADETGLAEALATHLRTTRGHTVTVVYCGSDYEQRDSHTFQIDPFATNDYERLLRALPNISGIVHLWSLNVQPPESSIDSVVQQSSHTALLLTQALLKTRPTPPPLWLVTRAAQMVDPSESLSGVMQAPLWGLGRTITLEHPELPCICVDLDAMDSAINQAQYLAAELCAYPSTNPPEDQIALRQERRYVARLSAAAVHETQPSSEHDLTIQANATYLITGGLGGLGLLTAEWLVEQGAKHIMLMGRRQPRPESQETLDALSATGAEIVTIQADVTSETEVAKTLAAVNPRYPLRGIIHAAGVLDDGVLLRQNWERFERVLSPKMRGAWNLHQLTKETTLDFLVLFSSTAGLFGSKGQSNHAAANAFLDALASYRQTQGMPALSINWGAWSEIGAAAEMVRREPDYFAAEGQGVIDTEQGRQLLAFLLQQAIPPSRVQIAAIPLKWAQLARTAGHRPIFQNLIDLSPKLTRPKSRHALARQKTRQRLAQDRDAQGQRRPILEQLGQALPTDRDRLLLEYLQQQIASIIQSTELPAIHRGFIELGMDSLMSIELRGRLQKNLQVSLSATLAFDYPTIERLAQFLSSKLLTHFESENQTVLPTSLPSTDESENDADSDGHDAISIDIDADSSEADLLALESLLEEMQGEF